MNTVGLFMYKNESKQRIIIIDGAIGGDFHFFQGKHMQVLIYTSSSASNISLVGFVGWFKLYKLYKLCKLFKYSH